MIKQVHSWVYNSSARNCPKLESTQMPSSGWVDKQTMVRPVSYSASYSPISVTWFMVYIHLGLWILDVLWTCVFRCPWRYGWFQVWDRKCTSPPLNIPLLWGLDWLHHNESSPVSEFLWLCLMAPDIHISPVGLWIPRRLRSWLIYSLNSHG